MTAFIATFVVIALAMGALAVGVAGRERGGCGADCRCRVGQQEKQR